MSFSADTLKIEAGGVATHDYGNTSKAPVKRSETSLTDTSTVTIDSRIMGDQHHHLTTMNSTEMLSLVRQQAFPTAQQCQILQEIVQANAVGYKVQVELSDEADNSATACTSVSRKSPIIVFVKQVRLRDYLPVKKDWADLRRTLLYARTEVRFYRSIMPLLQVENLTPAIHLAHYDLEGWIPEDEHATAPSGGTYPTTLNDIDNSSSASDLQTMGGWIILDCVDDSTYYQDSPLSVDESYQCLQAVAHLHAAAWQNVSLLQQCDQQLSRASFHLSMRNPKELAGVVSSWDDFFHAFESYLHQEGLDTPPVRNLGHRIQKLAHYLSEHVSPSPTDPYATLIHGDYKSLNVFLPRDGTSKKPLLVDFASSGIGLAMSDVAMHIRHAVLPHHLENGAEEQLVRRYWEYLQCLLPSNSTSECTTMYPWDVAWRHYKLALVDYFRFFLGRMWKSATPESLRCKADNKNVNLINRSIPAAMAFLRAVETYLSEIELEIPPISRPH